MRESECASKGLDGVLSALCWFHSPCSALSLFCAANFYMYIETSSPRTEGDTAVLLSQSISTPLSNSVCFVSFWYNMYGINTGSLRVRPNTPVANDIEWCRNGQQTSSSQWKQGLFWFNPLGQSFVVSFPTNFKYSFMYW